MSNVSSNVVVHHRTREAHQWRKITTHNSHHSHQANPKPPHIAIHNSRSIRKGIHSSQGSILSHHSIPRDISSSRRDSHNHNPVRRDSSLILRSQTSITRW